MSESRRWLFGDQLGPHFLDHPHQSVLMVESKEVFRRRTFHRQKAHLVLSAMRHRAAELGDACRYIHANTYAEALAQLEGETLDVVQPTSRAADAFVRGRAEVHEVLPARGFATSGEDFRAWAAQRGTGRGQKRLLMEDFYRESRQRLNLLMDGEEPAGGRWNLDAENREPPPKGVTRLDVTRPPWPKEDDIDAQVREDLDRWQREDGVRFIGEDGPLRFPVTRRQALARLRHFIEHRLPAFGPHEDAMLAGDDWMAHSLLSAPLNLGLLDPVEVAERAEAAYRSGDAPLASVEGFIRQVVGWRDYVWHLYWHLGRDYRRRNALAAREPLPEWFQNLDADGELDARCLSDVMRGVRENGWAHHIPRLMVLGNWALQRGYDPAELTDWFHRAFVDGYDWVMVPNVVGMSQHADHGLMATKPYASGGAYINKMSNYCGGCRYDPKVRVGDKACPFTAGYWAFLDRTADALQGNHRMAQPLAGLRRLGDREALVEQERDRGSDPP